MMNCDAVCDELMGATVEGRPPAADALLHADTCRRCSALRDDLDRIRSAAGAFREVAAVRAPSAGDILRRARRRATPMRRWLPAAAVAMCVTLVSVCGVARHSARQSRLHADTPVPTVEPGEDAVALLDLLLIVGDL